MISTGPPDRILSRPHRTDRFSYPPRSALNKAEECNKYKSYIAFHKFRSGNKTYTAERTSFVTEKPPLLINRLIFKHQPTDRQQTTLAPFKRLGVGSFIQRLSCTVPGSLYRPAFSISGHTPLPFCMADVFRFPAPTYPRQSFIALHNGGSRPAYHIGSGFRNPAVSRRHSRSISRSDTSYPKAPHSRRFSTILPHGAEIKKDSLPEAVLFLSEILKTIFRPVSALREPLPDVR